MIASTNVAYQGKQSMQITLLNKGNDGSISQYGQYGTPDAYLPVTPGQLYSFGCFFKSGGITQPSEHWLEWSSTKTGDNTNNRPSLPWPDYFTPHFIVGTAPSAWAYANRVFFLPAGFPNLEIRHRFTISSPGSGSIFLDNVFLRQLPAPADAKWLDLLSFGSLWRYSTNRPPTNWFATSFNDASWPQARAKFGAGATSNIVTSLPQQKANYYFRRGFNLTNAEVGELLLAATCTDD